MSDDQSAGSTRAGSPLQLVEELARRFADDDRDGAMQLLRPDFHIPAAGVAASWRLAPPAPRHGWSAIPITARAEMSEVSNGKPYRSSTSRHACARRSMATAKLSR